MVRLLTEEDAERLHRVRREALLAQPLAFGSSPEEDRFAELEAVRAYLREAPEAAVFGAFEGEELVGLVGVRRAGPRKSGHKAQIWGMYVASAHRGKGLGAALLDAAIAHARSLPGVDWVQLSVTEDALAARQMYERAGFQVWGTEPDAMRWEGQSVTEWHMDLRL